MHTHELPGFTVSGVPSTLVNLNELEALPLLHFMGV